MAEIVNLRREKKRRARDVERAEAAANRALHGQTPQARAAVALEKARVRRAVDGAALGRGLGPDEPEHKG